MCDSANERCPVFPGAARRLHWSFPDPSAAQGTDEERLAVFRRVRDEIRDRIQAWLDHGADSGPRFLDRPSSQSSAVDFTS